MTQTQHFFKKKFFFLKSSTQNSVYRQLKKIREKREKASSKIHSVCLLSPPRRPHHLLFLIADHRQHHYNLKWKAPIHSSKWFPINVYTSKVGIYTFTVASKRSKSLYKVLTHIRVRCEGPVPVGESDWLSHEFRIFQKVLVYSERLIITQALTFTTGPEWVSF